MRNPSCSIRAEGAPRRRPRHVAVVPKQSRSFLSNTTWARDLAALEIAIEHGEQLSSFIKELDDYYRKEIRDAGLEIGGRGAFDAENGVLTVMPKCP